MTTLPDAKNLAENSAAFYDVVARYYDAENENMTSDLDLYSSLAEEIGAPILEVGCGTGRVAFHLAQSGYQVTGLEVSSAMLDRARRKLKDRAPLKELVTFHQGDALNFQFPSTYRLILIPYNALMHFRSTAEQRALLRNLAGALDDSGLLVMDLPNAGATFATLDDGAVRLERTFTNPETGHLVMQQSASELDRAEQLQYITWIYDEIGPKNVIQRTVAPLTLRFIFPAEMDLLLQASGLRRVGRFGNYDQDPFLSDSERMIVLARKSKTE